MNSQRHADALVMDILLIGSGTVSMVFFISIFFGPFADNFL